MKPLLDFHSSHNYLFMCRVISRACGVEQENLQVMLLVCPFRAYRGSIHGSLYLGTLATTGFRLRRRLLADMTPFAEVVNDSNGSEAE